MKKRVYEAKNSKEESIKEAMVALHDLSTNVDPYLLSYEDGLKNKKRAIREICKTLAELTYDQFPDELHRLMKQGKFLKEFYEKYYTIESGVDIDDSYPNKDSYWRIFREYFLEAYQRLWGQKKKAGILQRKADKEKKTQSIAQINADLMEKFKELFKKQEEQILEGVTKYYKKLQKEYKDNVVDGDLEAYLLKKYEISPGAYHAKHPDPKYFDLDNPVKGRYDNIYYPRKDKEYDHKVAMMKDDTLEQIRRRNGNDIFIDDKRLKALINRDADDSIAFNEAKLINAIRKTLGGMKVKKVEEIYARFGEKGIEGQYKLFLEDGSKKIFTTHAISAGGWNIQVFHYRYLMDIEDIK